MIKNLRIGVWLFISFMTILVLVIALGIVSYSQTSTLSEQTVTMYDHPLTVRRSIDNLKLDIMELRLEFRNYILAENDELKEDALLHIDLANLDVDNQIDIIEMNYLGPATDIDEINKSLSIWRTVRQANIELTKLGEFDTVVESIEANGEESIKIGILLDKIEVVDEFAQNKADELYASSIELYREMSLQLVVIVSTIIVLTMIIGYWMYSSFKKPLADMNETVLEFQTGNMSRRVEKLSTNELGILGESINSMADAIEYNAEMDDNVSNFSDVIISENEENLFFKVVMNSLMKHTNSVSSSIHLLNEEKRLFECFDSIGFERELMEPFNVNTRNGAFGKVIESREIEYIELGDNGLQFTYNTVSLGVIPKEIVNIPIVSGSKIIGIITLSSLKSYSVKSQEFIERISDTLTSRSEAVLINKKVSDFVTELEQRSNELVAQNSELELQKQQLNEASKMKTDFLSNMSHELRTPLNSVIALSGVLYERLKGEISDDEYSYLEIIGRNGRNLLNLINDILDISRVESGKIELEYTTFDANECVEEVMSMFRYQAEEKGIGFSLKSDLSDLNIISDRDKCKHVIQNLIGNAVKFTKKGKVEIEIINNTDDIQIDVSDTGIGIDKDNLVKIFDEFKQAESGTSRRFGGTGLGLSIAKKYSELLGGSISVTSRKGKGSTFSLILPKKIDETTDTSHNNEDFISMSELNPYDSSREVFDKKILLIEDNESAIIQIKELVKGMGIQVSVATDGEMGVEMLKTHKVDGVILDLMMPGKDGFEVLKTIRNDDRIADVPVLVLTAKHITKSDLSELKRNNVMQLIQKGDIDRVKLQTTIFNMIFQKQQGKEKTTENLPLDAKILIVEDNQDNRITLKAILKEYPNLYEAVDGLDGVMKAKEFVPDVILMDIALPKMTGIEALREIKKVNELSHIPIIAITASALDEERDRILSEGFSAFVPKPIIAKELFKALNGVYKDEKA